MKPETVPFFSVRRIEYMMALSISTMQDPKAREHVRRELSDSLRGLANVHLRLRDELLRESLTAQAFRHHALRWHCLTAVNMANGSTGELASAWEWGEDEGLRMRQSVALNT